MNCENFLVDSVAKHLSSQNVSQRLQEEYMNAWKLSSKSASEPKPMPTCVELIDSFIRKGGIPAMDIMTLRLVKLILGTSCTTSTNKTEDDGQFQLTSWVLGRTGPTVSELSLASLLYPRADLDTILQGGQIIAAGVTQAAIDDLRQRLWSLAPMPIMSVLLEKQQFPKALSKRALERVPAYTAGIAAHILRASSQDTTLNIAGTEAAEAEIAEAVRAVIDSKNKARSPEEAPFRLPTAVEFQDALQVVRSIKSLIPLVEDPEDVLRLWGTRYRSVRRVSYESQASDFVKKMVAVGSKKPNATAIHLRARRIDCWNEQLWLALMEARRKDGVPIQPRAFNNPGQKETQEEKEKISNVQRAGRHNLTDIFFLEDAACEACCSVTSLSAYFADLMSFLDHTTVKGSSDTLLSVLSKRRPDLKHLQLSCANAMTLVPYISLVNETLESFVRSYRAMATANPPQRNLGDITISARNTAQSDVDAESFEEDGAHETIYADGNTDAKLYSQVISQQMFPFNQFPYNHARDTTAQILGAFGMRMEELTEVFRAPDLVINTITGKGSMDTVTRKRLDQGVAEVLERQHAAECLGMEQSEFTAITGETFFPAWFAELVMGLSEQPTNISSGCPWTGSTLWGYQDVAAMQEREQGLGLCHVKRQFMRRAAVDFEEVLALVKTQCFGQDLVITNKSGSAEFNGTLEELRLLEGASSPPFRPLSEGLAFRLQAFLRLRAKIGWSIKELDAAVYCLRVRESEISSESGSVFAADNENPNAFLVISPFVVKSIAAISRISRESGIEPLGLLPLWGRIDTFGEKSLMFQKFFTPTLRQLSSVFIPPVDKSQRPLELSTGRFALLQAHQRAVSQGLKWPEEAFHELLLATELDGNDVELDIDSLSKLYRYRLVAQILEVAPKDSPTFFDLFFWHGFENDKKGPLHSPQQTLAVILEWRGLLGSGWIIPDIANALGMPPKDNATETHSPRAGFSLLSTITKEARSLQKSLPFLFSSGEPVSAEDVVSCASRVFDAATSRQVVDFIEGNQVAVVRVVFEALTEFQIAIHSTRKWPKKLVLVPGGAPGTFEAEVRLTGELTATDRAWIAGISTTPITLKQALDKVARKSVAQREVLNRRFSPVKNPSSSVQKLLGSTEPQVSIFATSSTTTDGKSTLDEFQSLTESESLVATYRSAFLELAKPLVVRELFEKLITKAVEEVIPNADIGIIPLLLGKVVTITTHGAKESAFSALQRIAEADLRSSSDSKDPTEMVDVFFQPTATDTYTFAYVGPDTKDSPVLAINGLEMPLDSTALTWMPYNLAVGQPHHLKGNFPVDHLHWFTAKAPTPQALGRDSILATTKATEVADIEAKIRRAASLCSLTALTADEIEFLQRVSSDENKVLPINFSTPKLKTLMLLRKYLDLRSGLMLNVEASSTNCNRLIDLFAWLSQTTSATVVAIAAKLNSCTGWSQDRLTVTLQQKYPSLEGADLLQRLRSIDALLSLRDIMLIDHRLKVALGGNFGVPMSALFGLAQPRKTLSSLEDASSAGSLQARLSPGQRNKSEAALAENRRRALVTYILQHEDLREQLGIHDADGLFEHLLIDVQMGPELRTSRIKLAVGIIQLFVQRCLIGKEKAVPKGTITRDDWQWREQYSVWEAHRKLFLYPENWLDSTLRDDKSQVFEQFEASLMQKGLSMETFRDSIKAYLYGLNEISSLEVVAFAHDPDVGADEDVFHIFSRTRVSPYTFYYRSLTVLHAPYGCFWRPWQRMDMDIPSTETEWDGKKLGTTGTYLVPVVDGSRLYLFMPQLVARTVSHENGMKAVFALDKFEKLRETTTATVKPKRIWELTMSWTELVRGSWSPKRVCSGTIAVENEPAVTDFRFDPVFERNRTGVAMGNKLTLLVSHHGDSKDPGLGTVIGAFVFCEDQMGVVVDKESDVMLGMSSNRRPFTVAFQKPTATGVKATSQAVKTELDTLYGPHSEKGWRPILFVPRTLEGANNRAASTRKLESITWTMSYGEDIQPLGLALSSHRADGTSVSYFTVPQVKFERQRQWGPDDLDTKTRTVMMDHGFSHQLMQRASVRSGPVNQVFDYLGGRVPQEFTESFGRYGAQPDNPLSARHHELSQPMAVYDWEVGLHCIMLAVERFFATQQFEEALEVARLVFDPTTELEVHRLVTRTVDKEVVREGEKIVIKESVTSMEKLDQKSCWRFPPFQDIARRIAAEGQDSPVDLDSGMPADIKLALLERRSHGALVHASARGRPQAYMKWIVMKYAEILVAAGDVHFRRGTMEALPLATQRYIEASHVLGPEPPKMPQLVSKRKAAVYTFQTYASLSEKEVSNDLGLPFSAELVKAGDVGADTSGKTGADPGTLGVIRTSYFRVPLNPKFKELRNTIHTRLYNIRNSLDIDGRPVTYALLEPPIDPGALVALSKQGVGASEALGLTLADQEGPLPRQRFEILLRRAQDLVSELRSFGERLLSAIERKEGEVLNVLRAKHTTSITQMMLAIKQLNLTEAQKSIESLQVNREAQVSQLEFYLRLIGEDPKKKIPSPKDAWEDIAQDIDVPTNDDLRMSSYERMEMDMSNAASALNLLSAGIDALVAPLCAVPEIETMASPMGVGASIGFGGRDLAAAVQAGSTSLKMQSMVISEAGSLASRKAGLSKQLQERRLQANIRGREIKGIDKQIEMQGIRVRAAEKEIEVQQSELEDARQMETWYRSKYTNEQLYGWLEKELRSLYYQAYTLAVGAAKRAESSLAFEQGRSVSILKPAGYWDPSREGLLAADHLWLDLKRLESAHTQGRGHDYEVTKTVSLRQIDPLALLRLRFTGSTSFSLGEHLFDMDFPGHYMRRLRSLAVSIPAVVGPHTTVNATLTLQTHRYRVVANAANGSEYRSAAAAAFRTDRVPISSVAISSPSHDAGVFELSFAGEKYMPFEGAGAVSSWRLDLPTEMPKFDYETIADVVLHLQYTSLDGGACLKRAANESVRSIAQAVRAEGAGPEGFWAVWDLKNDFVNEWYEFSWRLLQATREGKKMGTTTTTMRGQEEEQEVSLRLGDLKDRLPFWSRREPALEIKSVALLSKNARLVGALEVGGVDTAGLPAEVTDVGCCRMRSWSGLTGVTSLDGWEVKIDSKVQVLGEKEDKVEAVYLLINYGFGARKV